MTVTGADIIAKARSYKGQFHDGADVPRLAQAIGRTFPEQASYWAEAGARTPWCGIFTEYVLSQFGIPGPAIVDGVGGMWVDRWLDWGTPVDPSNAQPGDVAIFLGSPHHVTFVAGGGLYCGGNQGSAGEVNEERIRTPNAVRRAPTAGAEQVTVKPSAQFETCVALLLKDEGGDDDDKRDPGGRTSRGITHTDWDDWRKTHPGLPSDVFEASQDQVLAIYHQKYWDVLLCDQLPAGVDYAVFDYGVNSGNSRSAKALQVLVGATADGEIGPDTLAAVRTHDAMLLVNELCDQRMAFLEGLGTWGTFGRGWTNRVAGVREHAMAMAQGIPVTQPQPKPPTPPLPTDAPIAALIAQVDALTAQMKDLAAEVKAMEQKMSDPTPTGLMPTTTQPQVNPQQIVDVLSELSAVRAENAKILAQVANKQPPDLSGLLTLITHGSVWGYTLTAILGHLGAIGGAAVGIPPTVPVITSLLTGTGLSAGIELLKRIFPPRPTQ